MTLSLCGAASCSRCPVRPSGTFSLIIWAGMSLVWVMWVLLLWLRLDCYLPVCAWDQPSSWLNVRLNPSIMYELLCRYWPHKVEFTSARLCASRDLPLDMLLVKLIGSRFDVVWSCPLGVLLLWHIGRDSVAGQCQSQPVTGPGQPVWNYKVIHSLWWLCWAWICVWRTRPCTKAHFYWHQTGGKSAKVPRYPKIHFCLPRSASCAW